MALFSVLRVYNFILFLLYSKSFRFDDELYCIVYCIETLSKHGRIMSTKLHYIKKDKTIYKRTRNVFTDLHDCRAGVHRSYQLSN